MKPFTGPFPPLIRDLFDRYNNLSQKDWGSGKKRQIYNDSQAERLQNGYSRSQI